MKYDKTINVLQIFLITQKLRAFVILDKKAKQHSNRHIILKLHVAPRYFHFWYSLILYPIVLMAGGLLGPFFPAITALHCSKVMTEESNKQNHEYLVKWNCTPLRTYSFCAGHNAACCLEVNWWCMFILQYTCKWVKGKRLRLNQFSFCHRLNSSSNSWSQEERSVGCV